jgi:hypothetical protein
MVSGQAKKELRMSLYAQSLSMGQQFDPNMLKQQAGISIEPQRTINEQVAEISGRLHALADDIGRVGDRLYGPVPSEVKGASNDPSPGNVASILREAFRALDAAEDGLRRVTNGL